ncbi:MAG: sigma-70 family RNA polymerase sigma factor [Planctomycetes bacterium]|nr:sigma-70 family RNA polymerase sigma factor [Planctomycetota bacterium]
MNKVLKMSQRRADSPKPKLDETPNIKLGGKSASGTPIKPGNIDGLWKQYLKSRSITLRNKIVVHYAPLVQTHAARLSRKLPAQVSFDEICSAAFDGLIEAVEAYDPERKAKFETFCQQRVAGAVMDWLRSLDPQSRTVRTFEKKRMLVREALGSEADFSPSQIDVARRLDMSVERYDYLSRLSQLGKEVHFSAMEPAHERRTQGGSHPWDLRDSRTEDPAIHVSRQILTEYLTSGLAREERLVLMLYYFEEMTMAEIGSVLNLSESRVSQIHKEILQRLRGRYNNMLTEELVA